jgi:hypothetical protein
MDKVMDKVAIEEDAGDDCFSKGGNGTATFSEGSSSVPAP